MAKMLKLFYAKFSYNLVFLIYGCFMTVKQPQIRFIWPSASIFHLCMCWNVFAICCAYLLSLLCVWWSVFAILQRLFGWDSAVSVQALSVILSIVGFLVGHQDNLSRRVWGYPGLCAPCRWLLLLQDALPFCSWVLNGCHWQQSTSHLILLS